MAIQKVRARTIYDSRGLPTVEVDLTTSLGTFNASVPSGASTGSHEAVDLRDKDMHFWGGRGVLTAVRNIEEVLGPAIQGLDPTDQTKIDEQLCALDATEQKSKLGANAILAVSLAVARAGAAQKQVPLFQHIGDLAGNTNFVLPTPCFNIINGGIHAGNQLAQQEFMLVPTGASKFSEAMRWASEIYQELKKILKSRYGSAAINVGDEGGFAPPLQTGTEALDLIEEAIKEAGYEGRVMIAFDSAASEFYENGKYNLSFKAVDAAAKETQPLTGEELGELYRTMIRGRPIAFVEDPFAEDDWAPAVQFTASTEIEIVGDDMLCTNPTRIRQAISERAVNALLLKPNQIGTLTEAIEATRMSKVAKWGVLTSHRSGETTDDFIADLSVGLATGHIKSGALARGERLAKYNRLLRIEEELEYRDGQSQYAGHSFRYIPWS